MSHIATHKEINLFDYWRVIQKYRKMIICIVAAASVAAVIISLIMPETYKTEAVIMPISSKATGGGMSALASQFGGLASLAGINIPTGVGDVEKLMAILKSRTLTENVINHEHLMPIIFKKEWDVKTNKWKSDDPREQPNVQIGVFVMQKKHISISDDKKNKTIKIAAEFGNPELAARITNAYIDELQQFINSNAFTMAKRNRIFVENQLEQNKKDLLEAGKEINEFYTGKRISIADAKLDVPISSVLESLTDHGSISIDNEEMNSGYQSSVTDYKFRNPVVGIAEAKSRTAEAQLSNIMNQKADLENKIEKAKIVKNVPQQVYLSYLMLRRELLAKVNALLTSQYEMAKIEESKEELSFQVIDKAVPPVMRYSPKRKQICIKIFVAALFGAVLIAFFREYLQRMKQLHREQLDGRR